MARAIPKLELELAPGFWTEVSEDLLSDESLRVRFGIQGNSPLDRVAQAGILDFMVRNDAGNSGATAGWYSPQSASCRSGFALGTAVRLSFLSDAPSFPTEYPVFIGKLMTIQPLPGTKGRRGTRCVAADWMEDAATAELRAVTPQAAKRADELITAILAALPTGCQPPSSFFGTGIDTFPYALDDLGDGPVFSLTALQRIVQSDLGFLFVQYGGLVYQNRQERQTSLSKGAFSDADLVDLVAPVSTDRTVNHTRVTIHPRKVDTTEVVVFSLQDIPEVPAGWTITLWGDYRDPTSPTVLIGATGGLAPAATTDYTANTAADGTGTDRTSSMTVTATYYASSVKVVITNGSADTVYLTKLQCRAKGIYNHAPVDYDHQSAAAYGDRLVVIDMPYQDDAGVGQGAADYIHTLYSGTWPQVESVAFVANRTAALMAHALARDPGDRITLSESMTGLNAVDVTIQSVELVLAPDGTLTCRWGLAPTLAGSSWVLQSANSKLGANTVLGYL